MISAVMTLDGLRGTIRSTRWSPVLVTPMAASAALLGAHVVHGGAAGAMTLLGDTGLAFTAVAPAFIADDATSAAAPATPVDARARLLARSVVAMPVAAAGWMLVLVVYRFVTSAVVVDVSARALVGLAMASVALAFAALGGRLSSAVSPGAVGVAAMALLGVLWTVAPKVWVDALPPGELLPASAILFSLATVAVATREPASF